jgi:hypothetical protein
MSARIPVLAFSDFTIVHPFSRCFSAYEIKYRNMENCYQEAWYDYYQCVPYENK